MVKAKRGLTWLFMLITFLVIIVYDVVMYAWFPSATISGLTNEFAAKYTGALAAVCTSIGFLLGHLFWPQYRCQCGKTCKCKE